MDTTQAQDLFREGEVRTLRADAFLSDSVFKGQQPCTVLRMEHTYGTNRFVLVQLHDDARTHVLVYPEQLS